MKNITSIPYIKESLTIVALNILLVAIVFLISSRLPPVIPLFYGKPRGISQLAPQSSLIMPPIIATIFTLLNILLLYLIKDSFLQKALIALSIGLSVLSAITIFRITTLVGNF